MLPHKRHGGADKSRGGDEPRASDIWGVSCAAAEEMLAYLKMHGVLTEDDIVRDPFPGDGVLQKKVFDKHGIRHVCHPGVDAFETSVDHGGATIIITNPPYSLKRRVFEWVMTKPLFPWVMIVPRSWVNAVFLHKALQFETQEDAKLLSVVAPHKMFPFYLPPLAPGGPRRIKAPRSPFECVYLFYNVDVPDRPVSVVPIPGADISPDEYVVPWTPQDPPVDVNDFGKGANAGKWFAENPATVTINEVEFVVPPSEAVVGDFTVSFRGHEVEVTASFLSAPIHLTGGKGSLPVGSPPAPREGYSLVGSVLVKAPAVVRYAGETINVA